MQPSARKADTLFNLAYDVRRSGEANMALYRGIADAAASAGVRRFIHASSIAVYDGWPTDDLDENSPSDGPGHAYKMAKRAMERDLEARVDRGEFDATIIQPVNVYGPFSAMWTDAIAERIHAGGLVLPKGFDGLNNGVYVDDLVDAFIAAGDLTHGGARRFIVAGPAPIPWAEMFAAYAQACGRTVEHEDWQPASEAPESLPGILQSLAMRASAFLASHIGTSRVKALRARLAVLVRGARSGPYRPVQEDPRFYLSRSVVHADRAATELCPPVVDAVEGLARTKAYIALAIWRGELAYSASVAMRWALAIAEKVMVEAGMLGNTEASIRWTRRNPAGRPRTSVSPSFGFSRIGNVPPQWKLLPSGFNRASGVSAIIPASRAAFASRSVALFMTAAVRSLGCALKARCSCPAGPSIRMPMLGRGIRVKEGLRHDQPPAQKLDQRLGEARERTETPADVGRELVIVSVELGMDEMRIDRGIHQLPEELHQAVARLRGRIAGQPAVQHRQEEMRAVLDGEPLSGQAERTGGQHGRRQDSASDEKPIATE